MTNEREKDPRRIKNSNTKRTNNTIIINNTHPITGDGMMLVGMPACTTMVTV